MSSSSPPFHYAASSYPDATSTSTYTLNFRIMFAAIFVLFFLVSLVFLVHLYARWFWHRTSITGRSIGFAGAHHGLTTTLAADNGLDKAVISRLPTFVYVKSPSLASTGNPEAAEDMRDPSSVPLLECAVCLSEFGDGEKGRMLPSCKHAFHVECIDMWFHSHSSCPLCRTVVSPLPAPITIEQAQGEGETAQAGSMEAATPFSDGNGDGTAASTNLQYPCNVLFYGNEAQVTSSMTWAKDPSSSQLPLSRPSSGRAHRLLHIAIEVPQGNSVTSPSPHGGEQGACTSPQLLKSPSLSISIKRMLSRQSSRHRNEGYEEYQKGTTSAV